MTFATDVLLDREQSVLYAVQVAGIEPVFVERTITGAFAGRTQNRMITALSGSASKLDLDKRREIGGALTMKLRDVDGILLALFAPRTDPVTWVTADKLKDVTPGGTVTVASTTGVPNTFYMGQETWTHDGSPGGTTLLNCARSLYGSEAQDHLGAPNDGSATSVYSAPPSWTGRKVTLYASVRGSDPGVVGTFRLEQPPQYLGGDEWELSATALVDWYAERPIMSGITPVHARESPAASLYPYLTSPLDLADVDEVRALGDKETFGSSHILFELDSGAFALGKLATGGTTTQVVWEHTQLLTPNYTHYEDVTLPGPPALPVRAPARWESARLVTVLDGDAWLIMRQLLVSRLGDEANGSDDVYPGRDQATAFGPEWHVGAGILAADVDSAAFTAMPAARMMSTVLHEETTVGELLREVCMLNGAYWYVNSSGQLTVAPLRERVPPSESYAALVIDDDITSLAATDAVSVDEANVIHTVSLECNWDPLRQSYALTVNMVDGNLRKLFPNSAQTRKISSKLVYVNEHDFGAAHPGGQRLRPRNAMPRVEVEAMLRRIQRYSALARMEYTAECAFKAVTLSVGDHVTVTNPRAVDLAGARLSADPFLVVGKNVNWERGTVTLTLRASRAGFLIAPALVVASFTEDGTDTRVTLDLTTAFGGATPGTSFGVGWTVRMYDVAADTVTTTTVVGTDTTTITLSGVSLGLSAGDIITPVYGTGLNASADGYKPDDFAYMVSDVGSSTPGTRWS